MAQNADDLTSSPENGSLKPIISLKINCSFSIIELQSGIPRKGNAWYKIHFSKNAWNLNQVYTIKKNLLPEVDLRVDSKGNSRRSTHQP